ncbi:MAG: hypothetical protein OEM96_09720 [Gemmatimonadota bacterium]|nr:hypothetical protein [Gemmatimonadota bacterium]
MATALQPWQILLAAFSGWISRHQDAVIEYLTALAERPTPRIEIA